MKVVALFVNLASAAFIYNVAEDSCDLCVGLVNPTATQVSDCLGDGDSTCKWTVIATWDTEKFPIPDRVCHGAQGQIFKLAAKLDHGLTFPADIQDDVKVGLFPTDFQVGFLAATKACTFDSYVAVLATPPDCGDTLDGWTNTKVPLEAKEGPFAWELKSLNEVVTHVRFVPQTTCWTAADYVTPFHAKADPYKIVIRYDHHLTTPKPTPTTSPGVIPPPSTSPESTVPGDDSTETESAGPLVATLSGLLVAGYFLF